MQVNQQRSTAVGAALAEIQNYLTQDGLGRETLAKVLDQLKGLAANTDFWGEAEFPAAEDDLQARYLIAQGEGSSITLYLNVMRPGKLIPPHNHTTWACVAAVVGNEHNTVFERESGGFEPGPATLRQVDSVVVGPGAGIALMPDDIHSVRIEGDAPIRHLHLYGCPLEALTQRLAFNLEDGTCKYMQVGVKTRR